MEYSALYRVSLSTLRRRIKTGDIEFKLIEGKYLLKNGPRPATTTAVARPEAIAPPTLVRAQTPAPAVQVEATIEPARPVQTPPAATVSGGDDQFWKATQGLLSEIKKAVASPF